jgi:hypothetical protein
MAYTLSTLRTYTRDLTGIYTTDIISDDLLNRWINEAYFEVGRLFQWPWAGYVTTLGTDSAAPAFESQFHPVLAYRAAAKVLEFESDDTKRGEFYMKEFNSLVADMYKYYMQKNAYTTTNTMDGLISNVRTWLDDYSDRISDELIEERIMDVYDELYEGATWSFSKTPFPGMGWDYTRVLVFGAAGRLGGLVSKGPDFVASMQSEFGLAMEEMKTHFLLTGTATAQTTRGNLRQLVRSVTGIYGKSVPDTLINAWINEEYQVLAAERNWAWLEQLHQVELVSGTSTFTLPNGSRKILEFFVVEKLSGSTNVQDNVSSKDIVYAVGSVLDVESNGARYVYDVSDGGVVKISPTPTNDITVRVRYVIETPQLTSDGSTPAMAEKFRSLLAYSTAVKVCAYSNAPQNIIDLCNSSATSLYTSMYNEYQLSHSTEPLQIGGSGLETRKYLPWFRTA